MNCSGSSSGDGGSTPPGRRGVQLQGPRPSPLSINKDSRKIGKSATASKPPLPAGRPPRPPESDNREPVVIYAVSPKPIHIDASDFKSVVQRLTGRSSSTPVDEMATGGPVSPAARLAALDRVSPKEGDRSVVKNETEIMEMLNWDAGMVDFGQIPGILSPAPSNLPPLPSGMFSPMIESQALFGFQDNLMSPFMPGNCFLPSPSSASAALFPGSSNFSPTPSPVFDFSTIFDSF